MKNQYEKGADAYRAAGWSLLICFAVAVLMAVKCAIFGGRGA